uniref:Immunoglobulin V-set domain-containing protein n=1 Tax=Kryptolebias marmoratus TaxID=37003 RepID=A0A3Q3FN68_KRYMA
ILNICKYIQYIFLYNVSHNQQDGAQCYGALRGAVGLQLTDASEIHIFQWTKDGTTILRKNRTITNTLENRSLFIPSNGTFRINNLSRTDSGEYKLEIFDSNGKKTGIRTLQLFVEGNSLFLSSKLSQTDGSKSDIDLIMCHIQASVVCTFPTFH